MMAARVDTQRCDKLTQSSTHSTEKNLQNQWNFEGVAVLVVIPPITTKTPTPTSVSWGFLLGDSP
jgi:hypothetical protein